MDDTQPTLSPPPVPRGVLLDKFELILPDDLATLVGVTIWTLEKWRSEGAGPAYVKLGKSVFYLSDDVEKWINQSRLSPSA